MKHRGVVGDVVLPTALVVVDKWHLMLPDHPAISLSETNTKENLTVV
jgi:hypothetical protein